MWVRKPRLVLSTPAAEWEPKQSKSVALVLMSWQRCYWRTNNGLASYFGSYIHSFGGDCKAHKTILSEIRTPPWSQKTAVTRHPRKRRHRFGKSGNNIKIRRYRDTRYEIRPPRPVSNYLVSRICVSLYLNYRFWFGGRHTGRPYIIIREKTALLFSKAVSSVFKRDISRTFSCSYGQLQTSACASGWG